MKRLFILVFSVMLLACGSSGDRPTGPVPAKYLGTWTHDETYIDAASDRFTRRRFTLQVSGDSTVLENWYGTAKKNLEDERLLNTPGRLGCHFDTDADCVLCGGYRWAGADTLRVQPDGTLHVCGRAYPSTLVFQKKN